MEWTNGWETTYEYSSDGAGRRPSQCREDFSSGITGGITSVVSIFTVAIGREHKSVPDYIAATLVIATPKKDRRVRLNGEGSAWTPN